MCLSTDSKGLGLLASLGNSALLLCRPFERFAEPQRRSRRTTFGSQALVDSSMLLLCRAVILSTHHNREITVKATLQIRSGRLAVQKTVTLGSRLLHLDVGNAPNTAQSLKSSPLLMLLCQG